MRVSERERVTERQKKDKEWKERKVGVIIMCEMSIGRKKGRGGGVKA